jgi:D-glycero-D-manno-heptose 1,7-bisphosphate phosphatase
VILAGGRGTRLLPITETRPKAMVEFHGKPFLEYAVEMLRDQGFQRILMLLGYLPHVIQDHFGDGSRWGVSISYSVSDPDDLTVHRVRLAEPLLDDLFLLLYCDNYWPLQMDRLWARYVESGARGMITVYSNKDGYSRDSVIVDDAGLVTTFDRSRVTPGLKGVEISYAIIPKTALELFPPGDALFEEAVYPKLAQRGELAAFVSDHRYYSVGSHERLPLTEAFLARTPTVILDRDGVLNERPPRAHYVTGPEDFRWLPGARTALRMLTQAGYRLIVVSNQAGIARGAMTEADLHAINAKMRLEAEETGGRIDAVYHCPHDWDEGCECRKPRPGMLFQAQRDYQLDLTRTYFVGDDDRDGIAANAAGCIWAKATEDDPLLRWAERIIEQKDRSDGSRWTRQPVSLS